MKFRPDYFTKCLFLEEFSECFTFGMEILFICCFQEHFDRFNVKPQATNKKIAKEFRNMDC